MENSSLKRAIGVILLVTFALWTTYYVKQHLQDFTIIMQVPPFSLLMLYLLFVGMVFSNGLTIKYILSAFGMAIKVPEFFSLSIVSALANYLTLFRGGAGLRALYLKTKYNLAFTDFLSTLSIMYLVHFLVNSILGLIGMSLLYYENTSFSPPIAFLFVTLFVFSSVGILVRIRLPDFRLFPLRIIARIIASWSVVRKNRNLFFMLIANNVAYSILMVLQTKIAFANYEVKMSWGTALFFSAAKGLALLLTITPGALGIVEWLTVYMGNSLAYTGPEALMAQTLMRVVSITTLIIISPFAARYLSRKI